MQPEQYQRVLGYFLEDAQDHLNTIHQSLLNLLTLTDNREELNTIFRATFCLKGGANMLGFSSIHSISYNLEKYLKPLFYIQADQALQKLFLDVYQILNNLFLQIDTEEGLTETKISEITRNSDDLFTLLNSHLLFLKSQFDYQDKLLAELNLIGNQIIPLKLILVDPRPLICKTYTEYFGDLPNVEIVNSHFEDLPFFDAIVTAASKLTDIVDIDAKILRFFGENLIKLLQQHIQTEYLGEQPIGTALIVETNHALHPFLIHTPSLRMPISEAGKNCIYQATWSTLLAINKHNHLHRQDLDKQINIVAFPGLGFGNSELTILEAAKQMSLAYKNFLSFST